MPSTPPHGPPSPLAAIGAVRRGVLMLASIIAAIVVFIVLPEDMGTLGRRAVAIGVFAAVLWATEALPLFVTSLSVIGLEVLLLASRDDGGGLAGVGDLSFATFFEPFASSTIILFLGGFLLAAAVTRHGLDRAVASRLLRPFMGDGYRLIFATIFTTGLLSVLISNTAVAAMMLAIITPIVRSEGVPRRLATALVLAVAFGASVGGFVTPVSTPPNAITISHLRTVGVHITFLEWVLMAAPLSATMLALTGGLLCAVLRPPRAVELRPIDPPERLSWKGRATAIVIAAAAIAWLTGPLHGVADAAVALIAATLLAALGVLERRDVRSIDWDVLLLMWGGLALGHGLRITGVLEYVGALPMVQQSSGWHLALILIAGGMTFATFMSNTAAANVLVPLAIALAMNLPNAAGGASADAIIVAEGGGGVGSAAALRVEGARLAVLVGLTVSFSISMPISTPPNAMAYATGMVTSRDMIRVGLPVSLIAIALLMAGYFWVLPLVLR